MGGEQIQAVAPEFRMGFTGGSPMLKRKREGVRIGRAGGSHD
jgi:hypothetical protein